MKAKKSIFVSLACASLVFAPSTLFAYQAAQEPDRIQQAGEVVYKREEVKLIKGSVAQIAAKTGFAARIPKNAEMYYGYKDIQQLVEGFMSSKIGKVIDENLPEEQKMQSILENESYQNLMSVAGEEVFFAGGEGIASFFELYVSATMEINKLSIKTYMNLLNGMLDEDGELDEIEGELTPELPDFFTKKDGALKMLKELKIAPLYAGFKVSDAKKRAELLKIISAALQSPVEEKPGVFKTLKANMLDGFTGFKFSGKEAMDKMDKEGAGEIFEEMLGKELLQKYKAEISKREFICLVGSVDDYIVFFAGESIDDFKFALKLEDSLLAKPEVEFARNYADKDVKGIFYLSEKLITSLYGMKGTFSTYSEMVVEALRSSEKFGDTREVQDLLLEVGKKEKILSNMMLDSRIGAVVYREDGYKIDSYVGKEYPSLDLDTPRKLAVMANHPGAVISGSWIANGKYSEATLELLETLFEALYKGTKIAVEQDFHNDEWIEFTGMFKMIDSTFSDDLLRVWKALKLGSDGLDNETAFMLDMKGRLPRIPEAPSAIIDNGPVPRIAYASNVKDRSKLSKSWIEISAAAKNIAVGVSKMTNEKIDLPKPERLKLGGLDIWSYQLGITTKDSNLALGINDELFFLTTSPNYIAARAADKSKVGAVPGAEMTLRTAPIRAAAIEWMKVLDESGKDFMKPRDIAEYKKMKPMFKDVIEASKELEKIDMYIRKVDGEVRSTIHVKIK